MRVDQNPFFNSHHSSTKPIETSSTESFSAMLNLTEDELSSVTDDETNGSQEQETGFEDSFGIAEAGTGTPTNSLLEEISKWANMSPAEKIRAQWLAAHGMTEETFSQLPPDEQAAINKEIAEEVKRQLGGESGKSVLAFD